MQRWRPRIRIRRLPARHGLRRLRSAVYSIATAIAAASIATAIATASIAAAVAAHHVPHRHERGAIEWVLMVLQDGHREPRCALALCAQQNMWLLEIRSDAKAAAWVALHPGSGHQTWLGVTCRGEVNSDCRTQFSAWTWNSDGAAVSDCAYNVYSLSSGYIVGGGNNQFCGIGGTGMRPPRRMDVRRATRWRARCGSQLTRARRLTPSRRHRHRRRRHRHRHRRRRHRHRHRRRRHRHRHRRRRHRHRHRRRRHRHRQPTAPTCPSP